MSYDKLRELGAFGIVILIVGSIITGVVFGTLYMIAHDQDGVIAMKAECEGWNRTNLANPTIVGTNDVGLPVKSYELHIPWGNSYSVHHIYEIGGTKTTIYRVGKMGTETIIESKE